MNNSEKLNRSKRVGGIMTVSIFLIFLFGFAAALLIMPDKDFSETENRTLAKKPELSVGNIKDGTFSDQLEKYISDQLLWKDALVSLKTDFDKLLAHNYQNGVYICKDNNGDLRYIQRYKENEALIKKNVGCINDFAESIDIPVDLVLVPNAVARFKDRMPASMLTDDQEASFAKVGNELSDKVNFYPMLETMVWNGHDNYYYRTDHHWTSEGAWNTVMSYIEASGQKPVIPVENGQAAYSAETVKGFLGTLYSKAPSAFATSDNVYIFSNPNGKYEVNWVAEGRTGSSIIDRSFFEKKDKYAAFLGGNFTRVDIKSNSRGGKVLVLKDSYANAAMQFLADQYSEITMIDLRYYHMQEKSVSELAKELGAERVIMLYNMDFLNEDNNFVWLN